MVRALGTQLGTTSSGGRGSDQGRSWRFDSYRAARVAAWRLRMRSTAAWLCTVLS
jgi:hypothetical protein